MEKSLKNALLSIANANKDYATVRKLSETQNQWENVPFYGTVKFDNGKLTYAIPTKDYVGVDIQLQHDSNRHKVIHVYVGADDVGALISWDANDNQYYERHSNSQWGKNPASGGRRSAKKITREEALKIMSKYKSNIGKLRDIEEAYRTANKIEAAESSTCQATGNKEGYAIGLNNAVKSISIANAIKNYIKSDSATEEGAKIILKSLK